MAGDGLGWFAETSLRRPLRVSLPAFLLAAALCSGCGGSSGNEAEQGASEPPRTTLVIGSEAEPAVPLPKGEPPKDLVVEDLRKGSGIEARPGDLLVTQLVAQFVGGRRLESSWGEGAEPFTFELGAEEANPGWEKGLPGMRVGGLRKLIVPPDEGSRFGLVGEGKPKDTLVYVVELVAILPPELEKRREPKVTPPAGPPPRGLEARDLIEGGGPTARDGDVLTVEYVAVHYNGRPFTNSWKRKEEFHFELGGGSFRVNPGWEKGLPGMRVGGRRELIIPPKLQYRGGAPAQSKPSDTLVYVIDLIGITEPGAQPGGPPALD
jgi:FKBP-type peptidyl-prolyl cis-trans isomerase